MCCFFTKFCNDCKTDQKLVQVLVVQPSGVKIVCKGETGDLSQIVDGGGNSFRLCQQVAVKCPPPLHPLPFAPLLSPCVSPQSVASTEPL